MEVIILSKAVILTNASRAAVSISLMAKGCTVA